MSVTGVYVSRDFLAFIGTKWIKNNSPRIRADTEEYTPTTTDTTVPDGYCISNEVIVQPTTDRTYSDFRVVVNSFSIDGVTSRTVTRRVVSGGVVVPAGSRIRIANEYCILSTQAQGLE